MTTLMQSDLGDGGTTTNPADDSPAGSPKVSPAAPFGIHWATMTARESFPSPLYSVASMQRGDGVINLRVQENDTYAAIEFCWDDAHGSVSGMANNGRSEFAESVRDLARKMQTLWLHGRD